MTRLFLLTDYKDQFGYKYVATPYLSGFDKALLTSALERRGFDPVFMRLSDISFRSIKLAGELVLYTSSQDKDLHYKSFIEDIVLGLQLQGARVVPRFEHLRAHHNKVFMEILRELASYDDASSPRACYFGTLEDLVASRSRVRLPAVVKPSAGDMSAGVALARNFAQMVRHARLVSRSSRLRSRARDIARTLRRSGYVPESWHRRKFIVQDLVDGVDHDWKVLVYGRKHYVVRRGVRPGDFRASGSGILSFPLEVPAQLLDACSKLAAALDVPWLSIDAIVAGGTTHVLEFQVLHFGTLALQSSPGYFSLREGQWMFEPASSSVEEEYAEALADYLQRERPPGR